MKHASLSPGRKLAFASLLLALAIVSTGVFKLVPTGGLVFVRFSLTPSIVIFASIFLGPFYGAAIGALSDLVPALLLPTGLVEVNFLITIVYALLGFSPYFFLRLLDRFSVLASRWTYLAIALLSIAAFAVTTFFDPGFERMFGEATYWVLPLFLCLDAASIVGYSAFLFLRDKGKDGSEEVKIGIVTYASEFIFSTFLKSLAFYLFLSFLSSSPSPIGFSFILCMLLLALPIAACISNFFVNVYRTIAIRVGYGSKMETGSGRKEE